MTLGTTPPETDYFEDGGTLIHAILFQFRNAGDIHCSRISGGVETLLTQGADFNVAGGGGGTGTVTKTNAGVVGTVFRIKRVTTRAQTTDYTPGDAFPAEVHEAGLDHAAAVDQEQDVEIEDTARRSLQVPVGEVAGPLPTAPDRAGKYQAYDALGAPVAASGTGNDPNLRTDLAASSGGSLVGYIAAMPAAIARSVADWFGDRPSVMDFIPLVERVRIRLRTSVADMAPYFDAAIAAIAAQGGGDLFVPSGKYVCARRWGSICPNLNLQGTGYGSHIVFTHAGADFRSGSGICSNQPSNSSTAVHSNLLDLKIEMTHAANLGACFHDNGSSFLRFWRIGFFGGLVGAACDQTEVGGFFGCEFTGQLAGGRGVWLVNGADITPGNLPQYTNNITVDATCQFNEGPTTDGFVDDGGAAHAILNPNFNGCRNHGRFAGVLGLTFGAGELESAAAVSFILTSTSLAGNGVAACSPVLFLAPVSVPTVGQHCITILSAGQLTIIAPFLGNTATTKINGTSNANGIFAIGANNGGGGATFDGVATNHFEIDQNGVISNLAWQAASYKIGANIVLAGRGAAIADAVNAAAAPTQAEFNALVAVTNTMLARMRAATPSIAP